MLIEYALHPGMSNGEISDEKIRIFSSTVSDGVNGAESANTRPKSVDKESFELRNEAHASMAGHHEQSAFQIEDGFSLLDGPDPANSIKNPSAYDGFLEHIDLQMKSLEYEIEQFISSQSAEEMGSEELRNDKWQRLSDIHMLVKETRERWVFDAKPDKFKACKLFYSNCVVISFAQDTHEIHYGNYLFQDCKDFGYDSKRD